MPRDGDGPVGGMRKKDGGLGRKRGRVGRDDLIEGVAPGEKEADVIVDGGEGVGEVFSGVEEPEEGVVLGEGGRGGKGEGERGGG